MEIECMCGRGCIRETSETLRDIEIFYSPCDKCREPGFKKFKPLKEQVDIKKLNREFGLCICGKRHLDTVMGHTLKIMMEEGLRDEKSTLRNTYTPLITPAYPTNSAPYLSKNSMVILADGITPKCAERIVNEIPEIKGVLEGNIRQTVGIRDSNSSSHIYELLEGCDMRCDVVPTPYGSICIYKNQGEIHIEFSKPVSPKIMALKKSMDNYKNPSVLDCTCGPGTLGIACLKAGAKRVVFNDVWYPATRMTSINLEVNGFKTNFFDVKKGLIGSGANFEVYCEDVRNLKYILNEKFDLCLIDTFPGVDTSDFIDSVKEICSEVLVI